MGLRESESAEMYRYRQAGEHYHGVWRVACVVHGVWCEWRGQ